MEPKYKLGDKIASGQSVALVIGVTQYISGSWGYTITFLDPHRGAFTRAIVEECELELMEDGVK